MLYHIARIILIPFIYLLFRPKVTGKENIPKEGSTIIYANHISIFDPILLGCVLPRKVHFMAKNELFKFPPFGKLLKTLGAFPVKRSSADITSIKVALKLLKDGQVFGIFPEGTRSKNGEVQNFTHGMAAIALKSKAVTIPIAIAGKYRIFQSMHITIGKPLYLDEYYGKKANSELLDQMTEEMSMSLRKL